MQPQPPDARFEDHVGELALALEADSLEDLFAEAARVVSRECGPVQDRRGAARREEEGSVRGQRSSAGAEERPGAWESVTVRARDVGTLLVDWLNEMIGRSEVAGRAYGEVRGLRLARDAAPAAAASPGGSAALEPAWVLEAEVRGEPVRRWESALKAATYHGLAIGRESGRWRANVLFDV